MALHSNEFLFIIIAVEPQKNLFFIGTVKNSEPHGIPARFDSPADQVFVQCLKAENVISTDMEQRTESQCK